MSREWQPGDVAMDSKYGLSFVVPPHFSGCPDYHEERGLHVHHADGDWNTLNDRLRPVAVIDPEDREQVERLVHAYIAAAEAQTQPYGIGSVDVEKVAEGFTTALREFANPTPPKPAEPLGLGAVVEDAEGDLWLRDGMLGDRSQSGHWWNQTVAAERNYDGTLRADWHAIAAVRVLSEGVTP